MNTKHIWAILFIALFAIAAVFGYFVITKEPIKASTPVVSVQPQAIHTKTETIREVAVQAPSQPGAVLQFVERQGEIIAIINGQEVKVPNKTGQPKVEIGKNGELSISTSSTARIDVTEMANAQAQLIANKELEKQAKVHAAEMKKEKRARNIERAVVIGIVGLAVSQ